MVDTEDQPLLLLSESSDNPRMTAKTAGNIEASERLIMTNSEHLHTRLVTSEDQIQGKLVVVPGIRDGTPGWKYERLCEEIDGDTYVIIQPR